MPDATQPVTDMPGVELGMNLPCPSCRRAMAPRVLACAACALRVEATFHTNEFALLEDDYLQLLRVFLICEGRIRDMEKVLGISYPTVKTRLAALRKRLGLDDERVLAEGAPAIPGSRAGDPTLEQIGSAPHNTPAAMTVLDLLSDGTIDHAEAVRRLRDG